MVELELDVRGLPKPDKHPAIFAAYQYLPVGAAFVLVNNDDPRHLRGEFEADFAGSYGWEYLQTGLRVRRSSPTNRPSRRTDLRHKPRPWGTSAPDSRRAAVMIVADELCCCPWRYGARAISMSRQRTREREPWPGLNPSLVLTQHCQGRGSA